MDVCLAYRIESRPSLPSSHSYSRLMETSTHLLLSLASLCRGVCCLRLTLLLLLVISGPCRRHRRVFERVLAAVEGEPFQGSVLERPLRHSEDIALPPSTAVCVWDAEALCSGGTEPGAGLEDLVVEHGRRALPLLACAYSSVVCIVEGSSGDR